MRSKFFIDMGYTQRQKGGNMVCGDVFMSKKIKSENRSIAVLSDGLGSGIKANVLATMTASMALNFTSIDEPVERSSKIIMNTLPTDSERQISYATFSIADIDSEGNTDIIEYGNPQFLVYRKGEFIDPEKHVVQINDNTHVRHNMYSYKFKVELHDRIIIYSDGVTQSGIGTKFLPLGWEREHVKEFVKRQIDNNPEISSKKLADVIVTKAEANDVYKSKDDITCAVIYCRSPRSLLLCSGPPFYKEKDSELAKRVADFNGKKVLCGGTTAMILSRETGEEIEVDIMSQTKGVPPKSYMKGVDLITEGIVTLGGLTSLLEQNPEDITVPDNPVGELFRMLMKHDSIEFVVGTRINNAHQDPDLPIELEIRRNVIKKIARLLEERFLKQVRVDYI